MNSSARLFLLSLIFTLPAGLAAAQAESKPDALPSVSVQADSMRFRVPYPRGWSVSPQRFGNATELLSAPAEEAARTPRNQLGRILITHDKVRNHAEAVRMLKEIADEEAGTTFLDIGGWPALQRRFVAPVARPSRGEMPEEAQELRVTTAIAAGTVLIRMEARIPLGADVSVADDAQAIGQIVEFETRGNSKETEQQLR